MKMRIERSWTGRDPNTKILSLIDSVARVWVYETDVTGLQELHEATAQAIACLTESPTPPPALAITQQEVNPQEISQAV
jgi:hypothetical protein